MYDVFGWCCILALHVFLGRTGGKFKWEADVVQAEPEEWKS
jgi:hypothetical protein